MGSTCSTCAGGANEVHPGRRGDRNRSSPPPPDRGYPNHLAGSQTKTKVGTPDTSGSGMAPSNRTHAIVAANYHSSTAGGGMESSASMSRHNSAASLAGEGGGLGSRRESYIIGMLPGAVSRQSSGSRNSSGSIVEAEGNSPPQVPQIPGMHRRVVRRHKPQYRQHGGPLDSSSRSNTAVNDEDAPQLLSPRAYSSPVLPNSVVLSLDRKPSLTQHPRSRQQSLLCAEDSVSPARATSSSHHQGGSAGASPMMTFVTATSLSPSRLQQQPTSSSSTSILSTSSKSPHHHTTTTTITSTNNNNTTAGNQKPSIMDNDAVVVVATSPTPESSPFAGPNFVGATSSGTTPSSNNEDALSSLTISPATAKLFHDHITTTPKTTMAGTVSARIVHPLSIAAFPSLPPSEMSLDDDSGGDKDDYITPTTTPEKSKAGVIRESITSPSAAVGVYHYQSTGKVEQQQSPIYVLRQSADNDDGDAESDTSTPTNNPFAHGLELQPTRALHTKKMRRKASSSKTNTSKLHPQPVMSFKSVIDSVRVRSPLAPSSPTRGAGSHRHRQQHSATESSGSPLILSSPHPKQQHQFEFHNTDDNLDEDGYNGVQVSMRDTPTLSSGNLSLERSPLKGVSGSQHRLPRLTALHAREKSFTRRHDSSRVASTPKNAPPAEYKSIFAEVSLPSRNSTSTNPEDSSATVAPQDVVHTSVVGQQQPGNPHSFSPRMRALARKQSQASVSTSADIPACPHVPHIIGSIMFGNSPFETDNNPAQQQHSRPTSRGNKDLATFTSVLNMSTCEENNPNSTDASRVWAENVRKAKEIKLQQSGYDTEASEDDVETGEPGDSFGQVGTPFNRSRRRKSVSFNDMDASQNSEARSPTPNNNEGQHQQYIRALANVTSASILMDSMEAIDPLMIRSNSKTGMSAQALIIGRRAGGITMIDSGVIETVNSSPNESRRGSVALSRPQSREENQSTAASFSRVVSGEGNMSARSNFWMSRSSIDAGVSRSGRQSKKVSIDDTPYNNHAQQFEYEQQQQHHPLGAVSSSSTIGGHSSQQQQHHQSSSGGMLTADYKRFSTLSIDSSSLGVSSSPSNTMGSSRVGGGINSSDRHHSGYSEMSFGHLSSMNPSSRSTFGNNSINNLVAVQRNNSVQSIGGDNNQPHPQISARNSMDHHVAPLGGVEGVTNAISEHAGGSSSTSPPSSAIVVSNPTHHHLSSSSNINNANYSNHQYAYAQSGFGNSSSSQGGGSPHRGRGGRGMSPVSHRSESSGGSSTSGSRSNSSGSARGGGGFLPCRIGSLRSSVLPVPTGAGSSSSGGGNDCPILLSPTGRGKAPMAPRRGSKPFASSYSYPMRAHPISSGGSDGGGSTTPTPPLSTSSLGDLRITTPLNNTVDTSSGNSPPNPLMVLSNRTDSSRPRPHQQRTDEGTAPRPPTNDDDENDDDGVSVSSANTDPGGDAQIEALAIGLATSAPTPNLVDLIAVAAGRGNQSDEYFPEVLDTIRASWSQRGSSGRNSISSSTRPSVISTSSSSRRRSTLRLPVVGGDLSMPSSPALTNEAYSASSFGKVTEHHDLVVDRTISMTSTTTMTITHKNTAPAPPEITGLPSLIPTNPPRRRSISVEAGSEMGVNSALSRSRSSGGGEETASSTSTAVFATHLSVNPNPFFRHAPHTSVENGMVPSVSMATIPSYDGRSSQGSYNNSSATSRTVSQQCITATNNNNTANPTSNNNNQQQDSSRSSTSSTDIITNMTTANDGSPQN